MDRRSDRAKEIGRAQQLVSELEQIAQSLGLNPLAFGTMELGAALSAAKEILRLRAKEDSVETTCVGADPVRGMDQRRIRGRPQRSSQTLPVCANRSPRDIIQDMGETTYLEAYARLNSLKTNLPDQYEVHEKWVAEFHAALDLLEAETGQLLASFRVPSAEVRPRVTSVRMGTRRAPAKVTYSRDNHCERPFLVMKIDGVLNYFSYQTTPHQRRIGFQPPPE